MKRFLSLLFFFNPIFLFSQSNVYHPFPDSNAVWNEQYDYYDFYPSPICIDNYSIAITGDTMINGIFYHKLVTPFVQHQYIPPHFIGPQISTGYKGAIREDTIARKVFFVAPHDSLESLLYNFNLNVGDTILARTFCAVTVSSIDSILIGSDYRKRWVSYGSIHGSVEFIEGIGSSIGLLGSWVCEGDGYSEYLNCFQQNGVTLWPSSSTGDCNLITTIDELLSPKVLYKMSPNPFGAYSKIVTYAEFDQLEIFNSIGIRVRTEKPEGNEIMVERGALPVGIYFFILGSNNNYKASGKFIIN
ncbi:MAG: T9SS type A sorting domain-containing protein [Bacteroidetes bacterium]|nr:MAG: T9SS type A sorting domain-containing protein [Bacteroidota bacterium]